MRSLARIELELLPCSAHKSPEERSAQRFDGQDHRREGRANMETLTSDKLMLFLAFVLPGFLSMRVYALMHPTEKTDLKESILEAVAFSIVNFALMSWAVFLLVDTDLRSNYFMSYISIISVFVIAPVAWPILLDLCLRRLENRGLILHRTHTAWDDVFLRKERFWVIVHLKDGRRVGGRYDEKSYASLHPNPGHLYLEELWRLDERGRFVERIPESRGLILRPDDYDLIELFGASNNGE